MLSVLKHPLTVVIFTQLFFTLSDYLARFNMKQSGFTMAAFLNWWFLGYFVIRQAAMMGQLYVFASVNLGKTMALFGAISIILSNLLGFLFLKEMLSGPAYAGIVLAVLAFAVLALS